MGRHGDARGRGRPAAPRRASSSTSSTSSGRASAPRSSRTRSSRSRSSTCPPARDRSPRPASASSRTSAGCASATQRSSTASPTTTGTTASRPGAARLARGAPGRGDGRLPDTDWTRPTPRPRRRAGDAQRRRPAAVQARVDALTRACPPTGRARPTSSGSLAAGPAPRLARREEKPAVVAAGTTCARSSTEELIDASEGIGGLDYERRRRTDASKSVVRRYRFEPQDHKFKVGDEPSSTRRRARRLGPGRRRGRRRSTTSHGTIDLMRGPSRLGHHPTALIPATPIDDRADARRAAAASPTRHRRTASTATAPYRAARATCSLRRPPRVVGSRAGRRRCARRRVGPRRRASASRLDLDRRRSCRSRGRPAPARRTPARG